MQQPEQLARPLPGKAPLDTARAAHARSRRPPQEEVSLAKTLLVPSLRSTHARFPGAFHCFHVTLRGIARRCSPVSGILPFMAAIAKLLIHPRAMQLRSFMDMPHERLQSAFGLPLNLPTGFRVAALPISLPGMPCGIQNRGRPNRHGLCPHRLRGRVRLSIGGLSASLAWCPLHSPPLSRSRRHSGRSAGLFAPFIQHGVARQR